jgi:DNA repair exonuclease SbcCD ATPase subunit
MTTYEAVAEIMRNHYHESSKRLTIRDVRDGLGGQGSLTKISNLMKRFYDENPSFAQSNVVHNEPIQDKIGQITSIIDEIVKCSTKSLMEALAIRDEENEAAVLEVKEQEATIEALNEKLNDLQEKLRIAESKLAVLEEFQAQAKAEHALELEKARSDHLKSLQGEAFYRGKCEAMMARETTDTAKETTSSEDNHKPTVMKKPLAKKSKAS